MDNKGVGNTIVVVFIALGALAVTDQLVPYGWKIFVLSKIFKIVWAVGVALVLVYLAYYLLPRMLSMGNSEHPGPSPAATRAFTGIVALPAAFVTLGYLLPDWNPWTEAIGALAATAWTLLVLALAARIRMAESRR